MEIKKVLTEIYKIDYGKIILKNNSEFIVNKQGISEFTTYLKRIDVNTGIAVIPTQYVNGLFFRRTLDDAALFSSPKWDPDIVKFNFNIIGLKKGSYYRIRVIAKSTGEDYSVTDNRSITVIDNTNTMILEYDFTDVHEYFTVESIFFGSDIEMNLKFEIGKLFIQDIIIDEVELHEDSESNLDDNPMEVLAKFQNELTAYGYFSLNIPENEQNVKYLHCTKLSGHGIILTYDSENKTYIVERDNINETINDSLSNLKYYLDINTVRLNGDKNFSSEVNIGFSPTTIKQGYYILKFNPSTTGTILIKVYRLN